MSKAIKVEDQVYDKLDQLRGKGETFSQVIEELLAARIKVFELLSQIEGSLKYQEYQHERLKAFAEANR